MNVILADNQDITRAGFQYILQGFQYSNCHVATDKAGLIELLKEHPLSVVVLDYTIFDINDESDLMIIGQRFPDAFLILFSDELSQDFVRRAIALSQKISVLLKESSMPEIKECLRLAMTGQRYICQRTTEMLLMVEQTSEENVKLTKTETEILKDIALGLTTKEIATKRFSSFHTVNTHRKNIFRKLNVNNAHEATKFALRAGLVDMAEYYI